MTGSASIRCSAGSRARYCIAPANIAWRLPVRMRSMPLMLQESFTAIRSLRTFLRAKRLPESPPSRTMIAFRVASARGLQKSMVDHSGTVRAKGRRECCNRRLDTGHRRKRDMCLCGRGIASRRAGNTGGSSVRLDDSEYSCQSSAEFRNPVRLPVHGPQRRTASVCAISHTWKNCHSCSQPQVIKHSVAQALTSAGHKRIINGEKLMV